MNKGAPVSGTGRPRNGIQARQEVRAVDNAASLLETKLSFPRPRSGMVARPRLRDRLDRAIESKLTLVAAPAGFGKTTLLSEWLAATGAPGRSASWLSLDQGDNEPASFWTYVITALQTMDPAVGARALSLLQEPQPPAIEAILTSLLNELGALPNDVVLVLDDYHLIDVQAVTDEMTFLLDHLPRQVHVVIATRVDPRCRWPACVREASSSRSAPPTCGSRRTRRPPT